MNNRIHTLSIVLNLHREGVLIEKTLQNLYEAIKIGEKKWSEIETIAVLDRSDDPTKDVIDNHKHLFDTIEEVDYGDLAHSRNHGVEKAGKHFILFADGDDFMSENALEALFDKIDIHYKRMGIRTSEALEKAEINRHAALFPKYLVEFPSLIKTTYYDANECVRLNNRFVHLYISRICTYRGVLRRFPLRPNEPPYGYEDWDLNNRLLAAGVDFLTADYTIYYRKENTRSLLSNQVKNLAIVRNSEIYSYDFDRSHRCEERDLSEKKEPVEKLRDKLLKKLHDFKTKDSYLKRRLKKISGAKRVYERITARLQPKVHNVVRTSDSMFEKDILFLEKLGEQWQRRKEGDTYDISPFIRALSIHSEAYDALLTFLHDKEILFFAPWIELGGADKVTTFYTDAVKEKKAALITTLQSGRRIDRITVAHLDLHRDVPNWHHFIESDRMHILIKAILNSPIKLIHIVNADLALKLVKYYGKVFREHRIKIVVSFFIPDIDWQTMEYHGYPVMYPEVYQYADIVISDNKHWYTFFKEMNGGDDFPYKKIHTAVEQIQNCKKKNRLTKKILWASRISNQKLFYLLEQITEALPEYRFVLYGGFIDGDNDKVLKRLSRRSNVEYRGEFNSPNDLDLDEFDLFLFTSKYEGVPNIVLEMAKSGIPMVASDVGGVYEVLGDDYPLLVHDVENTDEYVQKIRYFYDHLEEIYQWAEKIKTFVETVHTHEHFNREYRTLIETLIEDRSR